MLTFGRAWSNSVKRPREYCSWVWKNTQATKGNKDGENDYEILGHRFVPKSSKNHFHKESTAHNFRSVWDLSIPGLADLRACKDCSSRSYKCGPCSKAFLFTRSFWMLTQKAKRCRKAEPAKAPLTGARNIKVYIKMLNNQTVNSVTIKLNCPIPKFYVMPPQLPSQLPSWTVQNVICRMFQVKSPAEKHHICSVWWKCAAMRCE